MSWKDDIREQRGFEAIIALRIARARKALIWPNGNGRDTAKDFKLFIPIDIEVKNDIRAAQTGNFYFEIFNTKTHSPSGLTATKAALVYHFVPPNRLFNYDPKYLLDRLHAWVKDGTARVVEGGDDNSRGIIVPITIVASSGYAQEESFDPLAIAD